MTESEEIEKPIKKKDYISWSEYSQFKSCEHKYYISYKLDYRMPTTLTLWSGNVIHSIMEEICHKGVNYNYEEEFEKSWNLNLEKLTEAQIIDFTQYKDKLCEKFRLIVSNLAFNERFKDYKVLHTELKILYKIAVIDGEDFFFKGYVDLILHDEITDEVLIVDWKTSGKLWDLRKKLADKMFVGQILVYRYFVSVATGIPIKKIKCKYVALCDNGTIQELPIYPDMKITNEYLEDMISTLTEIKNLNPKKLKKQRFSPSRILCDWCNFNNTTLCNALKNQTPNKPKENVK